MTSEPDREHRERVYYGILGAIDKTGDERPGMSAHELYYNRCDQANLPLKKVKRGIRAACNNGDLVRINGEEYNCRYVPTDEATLRSAVEWLAESDDPDRESIAKINQLLRD